MQEKAIETRTCKQCGASFDITDKDRDFLDKMSPIFAGKKYLIPNPTHCPDCRQQRRLVWRNERKLYKRTCSLTGAPIVSTFSPDVPFPVYSLPAWFAGNRDATEHGREIDFSRSFFQQFAELGNVAPKIALIFDNNQNCEYTNGVSDSKNCYLIFGSTLCEDCMYGTPYRSKNCVDSLVLRDSQFCYECIDSTGLYNCSYCQNCTNSANLQYCVNMESSSDCFGCVGINNQKYCIFNKQYPKEEYPVKLQEFSTWKASDIQAKVHELLLTIPQRYYIGVQNENVVGNYIFNSSDCYHCFDVGDVEHGRYLSSATSCKNCMDVDYEEYGELLYENAGSFRLQKVAFGHMNRMHTDNLLYCSMCYNNVHDCFGCIALQNKQYCILNKQYTKEKYEILVPKLIEHMTTLGERGEFFPITISPYGYNETSAQDYYPLTREEAIGNGYPRMDKEYPINIPPEMKRIPANELPSIEHVTDDILDQAIICEVSGKPFRIIKPELDYYRRHHLPIPKRHPDQRHVDRMKLRNTRKLYKRTCDNCGKEIQTTYTPEGKERVYCEQCYNKAIY